MVSTTDRPTLSYPTMADLERLADKLALTPDEQFPDDDDYSSVNASRIMYRFWLRSDNEQELALMLYLDIMRRNRKLQPFIKMALRAALLETARHGDYFDKADDLYMQIAEMLNKIDWSRE